MTRGQPKLDKEIFLDRTHGGRMIAMLRQAGFIVNPITEVYPNAKHQFIPDPEWLRLCAEKDWIIVTGDKRIETVPENRQAVIDARARVFILGDSNSVPEEWAAAIIVGHYKMQEILDGNLGPFFVNIRKRADGHIARLRLPHGYEPPKVTDSDGNVGHLESAEAESAEAETKPPKPEDISAAESGTLFP